MTRIGGGREHTFFKCERWRSRVLREHWQSREEGAKSRPRVTFSLGSTWLRRVCLQRGISQICISASTWVKS